MGGRYRMQFETDGKGVGHRQVPEQAEKARIISGLTVPAGLLSRRAAAVGAALNASRTEMHSDFSSVCRV
jgi:hypothetical protein